MRFPCFLKLMKNPYMYESLFNLFLIFYNKIRWFIFLTLSVSYFSTWIMQICIFKNIFQDVYIYENNVETVILLKARCFSQSHWRISNVSRHGGSERRLFRRHVFLRFPMWNQIVLCNGSNIESFPEDFMLQAVQHSDSSIEFLEALFMKSPPSNLRNGKQLTFMNILQGVRKTWNISKINS